MKAEELKEILELHKIWVEENPNGVWIENVSSGKKANLKNADLRHADLRNADLRYADLSGADLRYADLSGANLSEDTILSGVNLNFAKLNNANMRFIDLRYANLIGAELNNVDLNGGHLQFAILKNAKLIGANLRAADLRDVDLSGADMTKAELIYTKLCETDFSGVTGLLSPIDYLKENFEITNDGVIAYKTFGGLYNPPKDWVLKSGSIISENVNFNRTNNCGCGINVAPFKLVKDNYNGDIWKVLIKWEWLPGVCIPYNTDGEIRCERVQLLEIVKE